jgi:hypothetical protein
MKQFKYQKYDNNKQKAKLAARQAAYIQIPDDLKKGYHNPGSTNKHKQA